MCMSSPTTSPSLRGKVGMGLILRLLVLLATMGVMYACIPACDCEPAPRENNAVRSALIQGEDY